MPYRSRIGASTIPFTDTASYRANNCVAVDGTNGIDIYAPSTPGFAPAVAPAAQFQQQPEISVETARKHPINVLLDDTPLTNVVLPPGLQPSLTPVTGSRSVAQFYLQKDGKTGVLALGSFSDSDYTTFLNSLLQGLLNLKALGATQLIVDVVGK